MNFCTYEESLKLWEAFDRYTKLNTICKHKEIISYRVCSRCRTDFDSGIFEELPHWIKNSDLEPFVGIPDNHNTLMEGVTKKHPNTNSFDVQLLMLKSLEYLWTWCIGDNWFEFRKVDGTNLERLVTDNPFGALKCILLKENRTDG